jgi:hypothetical protein
VCVCVSELYYPVRVLATVRLRALIQNCRANPCAGNYVKAELPWSDVQCTGVRLMLILDLFLDFSPLVPSKDAIVRHQGPHRRHHMYYVTYTFLKIYVATPIV